MCQFDFGLQGRKRKPVTKQSLCRDDMLGFIYHTVSLFLLSQLICMCLLWSLAVTLRKLPPPPPSLHLNSTLSPAFPPSLQLFRFFASFQRQWSRPPILSCFEMASARSDRESDLIEKIDELDRCGVRVCICVCTCEYVSQPSMTHTGLAHLSWSTRTMEASLNTAEGSCIYAKEGGGVRK